ncbi:MAG: PKD domain-containing protein [Chitinophagales bacterium]
MKKVYPLLSFLVTTLFLIPTVFASGDDCDAHPTDDVMHDEHCAVMALVHEDDATHIAVNNGSWSSNSTWNTGSVPGSGARVLIDSGVTVSYSIQSETEIFWIRVNGTLNFSTTVSTKLKVNTFIVDAIGVVTIGTETTPVSSGVTAKIVFTDEGPIDSEWDPHFFSKGLISHGGLTVYGASKTAYGTMSADQLAGATSLKLTLAPSNWVAGDKLVAAGTSALWIGTNSINTRFRDEELTFTSLSGKNVFFTNDDAGGASTLLYDHKAPAGYNFKFHVANLTRNVIFETENWQTIPLSQRAHIMLMHNANQNIAYASFIGMGRTDKLNFASDPIVDSLGVLLGGDENPRGRYALHVHRAGTNQNTIDPVNLQGCVVHGTPGWGIVNHSSNVVADENIVYDFVGAAYVTEAGNELGSFINNLALKGTGNDLYDPTSPQFSRPLRTANFDLGYEGDGFWLHGVNVECEGNIAASCMGTGFHIFADDDDFTLDEKVKVPVSTILNPAIAGGDDSIYTYILPLRKNNNSVVYNTVQAMAFWTYMYNADNIGDFSDATYALYSHNELSEVSNFKFWNLLEKGLDVTYSSQVYFKNGYILGDLENHFDDEDWVTTTEDDGLAVTASIVSGQFVFEDCTVKGWRKAMVAFRTDYSVSGDDEEYNYRTSKIDGGVYENNYYNLYPEKGLDYDYTPDFYEFPKYFEITDSPVFTPLTASTPPVADFTYISKGGTSVLFDGVLSSDPDPQTSESGNGIVAYSWDFGDGSQGYGRDVIHHYTSAGTYSATLTVYDCQGQTNTMTKNVVVNDVAYKNHIISPGFETSPLLTTSSINSTDVFVNAGWYKNDEWSITDGKAKIIKSVSTNKPLLQVIQNDYALQGTVDFSFQLKNLGDGAGGNNMRVEVIGVNGEFKNDDIFNFNGIAKWLNNDTEFSKAILLSEEFGLSDFDWTTFTRNLNFGSGYKFIVVTFYSYGLKTSQSDEQGVDNVCLPCVCQVPVDNFESQLTSTHVNLIWENVGASSYEIQIKPNGGSWTTYSINNTIKEFSDLIPNTTYNWKVRAYCDGAWTTYSALRKFITPVSGSECTSPTQTYATLITSNSATLSWNQVSGAISYKVQYRKSGTSAWTTVNTTIPVITVTGLIANSTYQWKVRSECSEGWKNYTNTYTFVTLPLKEGEVPGDETAINLSIYPNPASDAITIAVEGYAGNATLRITDLTGRIILSKEINLQPGITDLQLNISNIPAGAYILEIRCANGSLQSQKLLIE